MGTFDSEIPALTREYPQMLNIKPFEEKNAGPSGEQNIDLKRLTEEELVEHSTGFLRGLNNNRLLYSQRSFNPDTLHKLVGEYFSSYVPLMQEWRRRQSLGSDISRFRDLFEELRGRLSKEIRDDLVDLRRKQTGTESEWTKKNQERIVFLEKFDRFYQEGGELPFPWLFFLITNHEEIKRVLREISSKQNTAELSEEERQIMNFFNRIDKKRKFFLR